MAFLTLRELPNVERAAVTRAIRRAIDQQASDVATPSIGPRSMSGRLPQSERLREGAQRLSDESAEDAEAARYVGALLECCFLVAAADGLAEEERGALVDLVEHVTHKQLARERIDELLDLMAERLADEGLEARLDHVGSAFEDFMAREEAMSLAALVAISDRVLAPQEAATLIALGRRFDFSVGEVQAVVDVVANRLERALILESQPPPPRPSS